MCAAKEALSEAKGLQVSGRGFGDDLRARTFIDARATIGLSHPAVWGKAWHRETAELWIQGAL